LLVLRYNLNATPDPSIQDIASIEIVSMEVA